MDCQTKRKIGRMGRSAREDPVWTPQASNNSGPATSVC